MKRERTIDIIMQELCIYGGLLATRGEILLDMKDSCPDYDKHWLSVERCAFMCPPATSKQIEFLRACGGTLARVRNMER